VCLSDARFSHSHKTWIELSCSAPHLNKGLSISLIMYICLLRVLYPLRRPVTALDCVLLTDSSLVLAVALGSGIKFSSLSLGADKKYVKTIME
jgi:hypothetical protein